MNLNTNQIVSISEANRNFSRVARMNCTLQSKKRVRGLAFH